MDKKLNKAQWRELRRPLQQQLLDNRLQHFMEAMVSRMASLAIAKSLGTKPTKRATTRTKILDQLREMRAAERNGENALLWKLTHG